MDDFWALCLPDATEHLPMVHTRSALRRLRPRVGDKLVKNRRRAILHLVEDTSSGVHDTVIAACDPARYRQLGVDGHHANCRDNFRAAVAAMGIDRIDVPDPLNLFMNFPWDAEGQLEALPTVILDGRTLRSTPESDHRAGYDEHKRTKGSKVHAAVDTLGNLLAFRVTPADTQERAQVGALAGAVQEATVDTVALAYLNLDYTGAYPALDDADPAIRVEAVRLADAKRGFVLLPRRWVVERSYAWATRFRRLAKDDEWLPETVARLHFAAFACLMVHRIALHASISP